MYETHSSSHAAETATGPIVFMHGSLSSRHMWASYPAALGSRSAIAIDLPGYGDEPAWPTDRRYRLTDAAAPIRRALRDCDDPVGIVAHSFGGTVALPLRAREPGTCEFPHTDRAVLVRPPRRRRPARTRGA